MSGQPTSDKDMNSDEPEEKDDVEPLLGIGQRQRQLSEKGAAYQLEQKEKAWRAAHNKLTKTLVEVQDLLRQPEIDTRQLLIKQDIIDERYAVAAEAANALRQLTEDHTELDKTLDALKMSQATIKNKIIAATVSSYPSPSLGSKGSKASSETKAKLAHLKQKLKSETELREYEEEIERKQRQFRQEHEDALRRFRQEQQDAEDKLRLQHEEAQRRLREEQEANERDIARRRRDLERMRIQADIDAEEARQRAEGFDQDLDSDEDLIDLDDDILQRNPRSSTVNFHQRSFQRSATAFSNRQDVEANLNPAKTSEQSLLANLAHAFLATRLPVVEPPIFTGDPLRYTDWAAAFDALIDGKGISTNDKIFFLGKYLGGAAKEAVRGYFALRTETSYQKARKTLEDRFGNPFIISESFYAKLTSWPKISAHDHQGLQKFSDFLNQTEASYQQIDMKRLDDMREISKIAEKLPNHIINQWNKNARKIFERKKRYPKFDELNQFVYKQSELYNDPVINCMRQKTSPPSKTTKVLATHVANENKTAPTAQDKAKQTRPPGGKYCNFCQSMGNHFLPQCQKFAKESIANRIEFLKRKERCLLCLRPGHTAEYCISPHDCNTCKGKHPTCLHDYAEGQRKNATLKHAHATSMKVKTSTDSAATTTSIVPVLLSSKDKPDHEVLTYAILDSGSDATFIDEDTLSALNPPNKVPTMLTIETVNDEAKREIESHVQSNLRVRGYNSDSYIDLPPTYSIPGIPTNARSIPTSQDIGNWPHLRSLKGEIPPPLDCELGLLIGHNCWQALIPRELITGKDEEPYALKTTLGWSILGPSSRPKNEKLTYCNRIVTEERPLLKPIDACSLLERDFQEESGDKEKTSQDDIKFVKLMENSIEKNGEGFLEMPLPFRQEPDLPNNRQMAVKRLDYLKRKLLANKELKDDYVAFMRKIIDKGDAEETTPGEDKEWYLPHHGVYHPKKRKLRVVFDCAAAFRGTSLNNHLLAGPNLMNDLTGVFMRFRREQVALSCDIESMFHQFRVSPQHRRYLKFLWWKNGDLTTEPITYQMKVHLFGATSSPACANFGMKYMAKVNEVEHPKAANFIRNNFYVDDGLVSVQSSEEAIELVKESTAIFKEHRLRLHKFASNCQEVVDAIPSSERSENATSQHLQPSHISNEKTLGMEWVIEKDSIRFSDLTSTAPATRRGLLSTVASLYDPLGFLSPFVLQGKRILQDACLKGTKWDEKIEGQLLERWLNWTKELQHLKDIHIQRCYHPNDFGKITRTELHHFADASEKGYGMCTYLRFENTIGQVHCALVAGKSRVAPRKAVSIPRLELTAAVLSAKIGTNIKRLLQINIDEEFFWTDSNIVLAYINNDSKRFHTFVANRIQKIKDITNTANWHHVSTSGNPADHASRGLTLSQLPDSSWLKGPEWLWQLTFEVPVYPTPTLNQHDPEVKISLLCQMTQRNHDMDERLSHISKWTRARRVVARILRLARKEKTKDANPTPEELLRATKAIIGSVQKQFFRDDWQRISTGKNIRGSSPLSIAEPFLHDGILRAKGRIKSQLFKIEEKHPIILPRCHTSSLIIAHAHERTMHQGRGMTMNEVKAQGYWIMGASKQTATLLKNCVTCRKLRGNTAEQIMGDLPDERTEPSPPFTNVGMDCFGPITVKNGRKETKRYGLLFTCMCSRGVHIEMLDDLSTDCFINGLRCFTAIRGPVRKIFCDQGSNFIGADNEFKKSLEVKLQRNFEECEFSFNPPHAPHRGGVWERQVKTVKSVLTAITALYPGRMDDSSLRTYLYEAMNIVNSRPITPIHQSDPSSPEALTPNHIITMKTSQLLSPPGPFQREDVFLQKRWRRVQFLLQQFWSRWKKEYVAELSKRQKWRTPRRNIQTGDVVLLADENTPRNKWPLARVVQTIPGKDGFVRKVVIEVGTRSLDKTGKRQQELSKLERPIQKLVLVQEHI